MPPPPPPMMGNVGYVRPSWLPGMGPNTPLPPPPPPPPPPYVPLERKKDKINEKDKSDDQGKDVAVYAYDPAPDELDSELDVGSDYSRRTPTAPPPIMPDVTGEVLRTQAEGLSHPHQHTLRAKQRGHATPHREPLLLTLLTTP